MQSFSRSAWIVLALLVAVGCRSDGRSGGEERVAKLVVASDLDNMPFAGVDADGQPQGRDVEMMAEIARALDTTVEWRRMPFDELLPAVERGEVDVVCATLGITPERAERVLFSRPYFVTDIAVVVRAAPGEPRTLEDLAGRPVAAGRGTTSERALRAQLPRAAGILENKSGAATPERLLGREVDAAVLDGPSADALVAASQGRLVRLDEPLDVERYALALPMDRAALRDAIDRVLARLEADGTLAQLDARHGLSSKPDADRKR